MNFRSKNGRKSETFTKSGKSVRQWWVSDELLHDIGRS